MLIDERKPLGTDPPLESDLLERELENGVTINQGRTLGGVMTTGEVVFVRDADLDEPAGDITLKK